MRDRLLEWFDGLPWWIVVPAMPFLWATLAVLYIVYCLVAPFAIVAGAVFYLVRWAIKTARTR